MEKRTQYLIRRLLTIAILGFAIVTTGCSFSIGFNIKNLSENTVTVTYVLKKDSGQGFSPQLFLPGVAVNGSDFIPFPEDRIRVDKENRVVELKLLPNETVELFRVHDRRDNDYQKEMNLATLRIAATDGAMVLEGQQIFKSFRPVKNSWYMFGPEIAGFEFEYR